MANSPLSEPEGSQNPSVLLSPEMVCSVRQHPLSGNSGRKRYNTLDFARQNRVPTGRFRPYWKPRIKGICHPFEISAVLKSVYTNRENAVCIYTSQNEKIPTVDPPARRGKTVGIFKCRIHRNGRNSCVTHRCGGGENKRRDCISIISSTMVSCFAGSFHSADGCG